jgi:hypothetical protein
MQLSEPLASWIGKSSQHTLAHHLSDSPGSPGLTIQVTSLCPQVPPSISLGQRQWSWSWQHYLTYLPLLTTLLDSSLTP